MTPIEKAAQEAAEEYLKPYKEFGPEIYDLFLGNLTPIITRHLAPIQAELDAKDRLLREAMRLIEYHSIPVGRSELKDWLEKVNTGDRKGNNSNE